MKNSTLQPHVFFSHHSSLAQSSQQPRQPAFSMLFHWVPASPLGQAGPQGCSGVFCPSLIQQPPGDPLLRGGLWRELWIKTGAVSGLEKWTDKASSSTCQSVKLNTQTSGQLWKPRLSFTVIQLSFPYVVWEKQVPDDTCLIITPFPKDKGPCSSCTEGRADTYGGSSGAALCHQELTGHIEIALSHVPTSEKDNCIKGWLYIFFQFLIRWNRRGEPQWSKPSINIIMLPFLFVVLMPSAS